MTANDHVVWLGKLIGNLQILETVIRTAIVTLDRDRYGAWKWEDLQTSRELPNDAFTSYDSLGPMIALYNALVAQESRLDGNALVTLRDALAHGRVYARAQSFPVRLVKFGRPNAAGRIPVELAVDMTEEWFDAQVKFVHGSIETVGARQPVGHSPGHSGASRA